MKNKDLQRFKTTFLNIYDIIANEGVYQFYDKRDNIKYPYYFFTFLFDGDLISFYCDLRISANIDWLKKASMYKFLPYYGQIILDESALTIRLVDKSKKMDAIVEYLQYHSQVILT